MYLYLFNYHVNISLFSVLICFLRIYLYKFSCPWEIKEVVHVMAEGPDKGFIVYWYACLRLLNNILIFLHTTLLVCVYVHM